MARAGRGTHVNAGRRHLDEADLSCEKRHPARRPGLMRERGSETAARSWTALLRDNYIIGLGRLTVKSKQKMERIPTARKGVFGLVVLFPCMSMHS